MSSDAVCAVVFDLDGVLVDSRQAITRSINHALSVHGFPESPPGSLHRFIGPPLVVAFAELTSHPSDSAPVRSCVRTYRERYSEASLVETVPVDGVAEILSELAGRFSLAVATSKPLAFAEPLLVEFGLRGYFAAVAGPDLRVDVEEKSVTIGAVLRALGAERAVMVGDRSFDIVGAHTHGIPAIGAAWGIGSIEELRAAQADLIIADPRQLRSAISSLIVARTEGR